MTQPFRLTPKDILAAGCLMGTPMFFIWAYCKWMEQHGQMKEWER